MPGYGIAGPDEGTGLLPWSWATERLSRSHDYWVATMRPDGRPHLMPVWGVWLQDSVWFSSSGDSRKTRNLTASQAVVVATDDPQEPVVVEGDAERVTGLDRIKLFVDAVNTKYGTAYSVEFFAGGACFRVRPASVFALTQEDFAGSPTRWTFDGQK